MSSKGSVHGQFQRALAAGHTVQAYALASELPKVRLEDALSLCLLLAADRDWRFERAAKRWLQRYSAEGNPSLQELLMAGAAFAELGSRPDSDVSRETLRRLVAGP